jgi:hypothetical protein
MTSNGTFRHLDTITAFYVAVLLISNVASTKVLDFGPFTFDGGTILFPLSYIFGDILTEVYGYRKTRKVIWLGFASAFLMAAVFFVVGVLPPARGWEHQDAYEKILGMTPRIVTGSLLGYWAGEFSNSYILAKLKIATRGRWLWTRTISSTLVGQAVDTGVFLGAAFGGIYRTDVLLGLFLSNYIFKCLVEILCTPLTYAVVRALKRQEGVDVYDTDTRFNPFVR